MTWRLLHRFSLMLVTLLLVFVSQAKATSLPVAQALPVHGVVVLDSQLLVRRDSSARLGIDAIADPAQAARLRPATRADFSPGYTHDAIWLRVSLVNPDAITRQAYLEIGPPRLQDIHFYGQLPGGGWEQLRAGTQVPVAQRMVVSRESVFPLMLAPGEQRSFYVRIASGNAIAVHARLWSPLYFHEDERRIDLINGVQFGAIVLFAVFSLLLFLAIRQNVFLYFFITLFSYFFYEISFTQYAYQYFWTLSPDWNVRAPGFFIALTIFGSGLLTRELLNTRQYFPKTDLLLLLLSWLSLINIPAIIFLNYGVFVRLSNYGVLLLIIVSVVVAFRALINGHKGALIFLLGFIFHWSGTFLRLGQIIGFFPANLFFDYSQSWLIVFSSMLMAVAFSINIRRLRRNSDLADKKIISARIEAKLQAERDVDLGLRELRMARDVAEASSRAKSTFIAHLSHELRTPLHSILGYSNLIRNDSSSAVDRRRIEAVQGSGRHLLELIDELLDYARIEAGRLKIELRPTFVSSFLVSVVEETSELARACGTELHADIASGLPAVAMLDSVRLRQVLINLIANACRHSQSSRISLEVSGRHEKNGSLTLCLGVRDNGVGVPAQDRARIFSAFEQGAAQGDRHGMGLGLAISWQLVQLMGGELFYEAPAQGGSLFHFCIETEVAEEAQVASVQHSAGVRRYVGPVHRILIVDDMADNRALLADMLASSGFDLAVAASGEEALSVLATESFSLVVTDQFMPGMSGWQLLRGAREAGHVMPFVLLSAALPVVPDGWMPHHVFAAILMKPVEPERLADVLADILDLQWETKGALPEGAAPLLQRPPAEVLVPLREAVEQGRITDIEDWVEHILATRPDSHDFALAVRNCVRRLDLAGILGMIDR